MLAVVETHPIQYHAPVYRELQQQCGVPVTVIYGSDFSVAGYRDQELEAEFAWDTDLLSGYSAVFLARSREGGARNDRDVSAAGLQSALRRASPRALLLVAYQPGFHRRAYQVGRRLRLPLLFRGETTDHAVHRRWWKRAIRDWWLRRRYSGCRALLAVGQRSREHFQRLGVPAERLFYSPYCVDTTPFRTDETDRTELRPGTREELALRPEDVVFLFCGKLSPRKAPLDLVEAVRRLLPLPTGRYVVLVVGDGELRTEMQNAAAAAPQVELRMVGFQNQHALSRYYHAADVLVLPSIRSETWGLVVNEALHHGLPVVVSDAVGCAPDLVRSIDVGRTFSAGSREALAAALGQVTPMVSDPKTRLACRAAVVEHTVRRAALGIADAFHAVTRASDS